MNAQINGWTVLLLLVALAMGYGFALINVQVMIPAAVAEISGQRNIVQQINTAFQQQRVDLLKEFDTRFTKVETRVDVLEKQK